MSERINVDDLRERLLRVLTFTQSGSYKKLDMARDMLVLVDVAGAAWRVRLASFPTFEKHYTVEEKALAEALSRLDFSRSTALSRRSLPIKGGTPAVVPPGEQT